MTTVTHSRDNAHAPQSSTRLHPAVARFFQRFGPPLILIAVAAQSADVMLAKKVFNLTIGDAEWVSWMVAIALTAAAAISSAATAIAKELGNRAGYVFAMTVWLGLGVALALIRVAEPVLTGGKASQINIGGAAMAVLILVLYLGAGHVIQLAIGEMFRPALMEEKATRRNKEKVARRLHNAEGELTQAESTLTGYAASKQRLADELTEHLAEVDANAAELKQRARQEVAAVLKRADATSLYRQPTWPEPQPGEPAA